MEGDIRILWALLGLSMAVPVLSGCATVTVDTSAGTISARGIFGTETLPLAPAVVRVHGLGVFRTAYSVSVGWQSETSIYISGTNGCRIFLVGNTPAEARELMMVLAKSGVESDAICLDRYGDRK